MADAVDGWRIAKGALQGAFWLGLYVAFVCAAFALRGALSAAGATEVWGFDYGTFVRQIQDWRWIAFFGFRHPGLGLVMSPLVALERLWPQAYLFVMPGVAWATVFLLWRFVRMLSGIGAAYGAVVLWLAMPYTWILAGVPESFPVAQLALVAAAYGLARNQTSRKAVAAFSVLNACVTLTNGIKPAFAWFVLRARRRERLVGLGAGMLALLLGVAFFAVRAQVTGRPVADGVLGTLAWIPDVRNWRTDAVGFFLRPVGWISVVVYPVAALGIWAGLRAGREHVKALEVLGLFVLPDFVLHLVVGWGMEEPWLFFAHWGWVLAVLSGSGLEIIGRLTWSRRGFEGSSVFCSKRSSSTRATHARM